MTEDKINEILKEMWESPTTIVKPSTIKISEEGRVNGHGIWIGIERQTLPGEDEVAAILSARQKILSAFNAIDSGVPNYSSIPGHPQQSPIDQQEQMVQEKIKEIEGCNVISEINRLGKETGLLAYANETEARIKAAFEFRMLQLNQKQ